MDQAPECGAKYLNKKTGREHVCSKAPGHEGPHRCPLCGGEWVDLMEALVKSLNPQRGAGK